MRYVLIRQEPVGLKQIYGLKVWDNVIANILKFYYGKLVIIKVVK